MALEVVGIVGLAIGLVPMLQDFLTPDPKAALSDTSVRIMLGTSNDDGQSFGGNTPGASLWDFKGHAIGFTAGTSEIKRQGEPIDISIHPRPDVGAIQAEYLSISNGGNDAICMAGIAVFFPDGAKAGFSTNVAARCGAFWSNSRTPVIGQPISGEAEPPKCVWIDRDGSGGIPHQGMGIHLPSFSSSNENLAAEYESNNDFMCKSGPRFRMYPQLRTENSILVYDPPLVFVTQSDNDSLIGTDADLTRIINNPGVLANDLVKGSGGNAGRDVTRRGHRAQNPAVSNSTSKPNGTPTGYINPLATRVIISSLKFNTARALCESETSYGHSFASTVEGLFCDMVDRSLYFTCNDKITTCCFDTDKASFRACRPSSTRPPLKLKQSTVVSPGRLRVRQANDEVDPAWTKDSKDYQSVQRW